jgi:hypothetical protein
MKMQRTLWLILVLLLSGGREMMAQGTAFTYQGQLIANGGAASGGYDLRFAVFDSAGATNQIGSALTNLATPVTNGLFTVTLDFGTGVFTGPPRWLEVGVRTNGTSNFTTLSPLQLLTAAPYAVAAGNLLGTLPASQLPSTVVTNNEANLNLTGTFAGNGSGLTNTPGSVLWQAAAAASLQAQANTGYLLTNSQLVTLTLPASPNIGSVVQVAGVGSGGWLLAQNAGQWISGSFIPLWAAMGAPNDLDWSSIASSSNGTKLAAVASGNGIYTSINSGANWTHQISAPNEPWVSIASSSDGTKLAAADDAGDIYTSINSGTNWALQFSAPGEAWQSIASSSDGTKLAVVATSGGIYTSINSGSNWTLQFSARGEDWQSLASSSDGTLLSVVVFNGGIYTSINSGTNWTQQLSAPSEGWDSISSSSDGTRLAAVDGGGGIFTSINSGTNWTLQFSAPDEAWQSIASSSDGTKLAVVDEAGDIYTSINSGTNWTDHTNGLISGFNGSNMASSSDGTHLAAVAGPNGIYTSINSGTNWTQQTRTFLPATSSATTIGTTGFLQGAAGTSIQLIYAGGGEFVEVSQLGTIYDH